jgi:shikimate dehydrogenase
MGLTSGRTLTAGVVGRPVAHSLSPLIHSAWLAEAGIDGAYVPFPVAEGGFQAFVHGMRGGAIRGVNVTIPFKEDALALADEVEPICRRAGAANLLLFHHDGRIEARNTDGLGLIRAMADQAGFDPTAGPVVILGAGGAARGAGAALIAAGAPELRLVNRTWARASGLAEAFPYTYPFSLEDVGAAFEGAAAVVNATSAGLNGVDDLDLPLERLPPGATVMDMVYKPLETGLLRRARSLGLKTADGLAMLIHQAIPSFEAYYGQAPPERVDVRALALAALGQPR